MPNGPWLLYWYSWDGHRVSIWTDRDRAWPRLRTVVRVHPATIQAWSRGY